jgi:hypothetical protein
MMYQHLTGATECGSIQARWKEIAIRISLIPLAGVVLCLTGCNHLSRVPMTSDAHPSRWAPEVRVEARTAWPYAQLAFNAYQRPGEPDRVMMGTGYQVIDREPNDANGFGFIVVEHTQPDGTVETIVAFRGTDFLTWQDWLSGNLGRAQNEAGLALVDRLRANCRTSCPPITVTGHSLGGAIATHVSLHRPNVTAWVFNASPHFWRDRRWSSFWPKQPETNERHSIVEHGEVLKMLRVFGREADQLYTSIGCTRRGLPIGDHDIDKLANCLTRIAAWDEPEARAFIQRNRICWPIGAARPPELATAALVPCAPVITAEVGQLAF